MTRVVIDTNVYISALIFGGLPGSLLDLVFLGAFEAIVSAPLLDELEDKLRQKFRVSGADAALIRARLSSVARLVSPIEALQVISEDPDDDRVLECAVAGRADHIVSGDRHLLALGSFRAIKILRVREFLTLLDHDSE
jgi:uncharacterized protein